MNLIIKVEMLERRIAAMKKEISRLKEENDALRDENRGLLDRQTHYKEVLEMTEELRDEYEKDIAELHAIKEQYSLAVSNAQKMKKDFTEKFKVTMKQMK